MDALETRGFFAGLASSSPCSALVALALFGAALPFPLTGAVSSSAASTFGVASASLIFEVRGVFLGGLISSSDRADDSLPGDSALIDREAAARFGLVGDDMMNDGI